LHRLQANGRYAHEASYVKAALASAGFENSLLRREPLRKEGGAPVIGYVCGARASIASSGPTSSEH
jgi:predicted TPR repeat methyltransferase